MFPLALASHGKVYYLFLSGWRRSLKTSIHVILLFTFILDTSSYGTAFAHKVKTTADVGATLHLEPNDNPRAGEPTKTWFALTRKGGKEIPLAECNCQLVVYAEPHLPKEPPLLEPSLQPLKAERYQGIPGTEITFPRPGAYQLQLSGKPKQKGNFQPFELKFTVTVAAGSVQANQQVQPDNQNVPQSPAQSQSQGVPFWAIALSAVAAVGVFFVILRSVGGRGR